MQLYQLPSIWQAEKALHDLKPRRPLAPEPAAYKLLPDVISAEPLTLLAQPDQELESVLFWSFQVMLNAEALGVSSKNIDAVVADLENQPAAVRRMLGADSAMGNIAKKLGIADDWAIEIIRQVGNYGEVFERTIGTDSPMGLDRAATPNRLWTEGGLLYAHPIR